MVHFVVLLVGLALGVLFAYSGAPRVRALPMAACTLLALAAAAALLWSHQGSAVDGFLLVVSVYVASLLTSGLVWRQTEMGLSRSYRQWVYLSVRAPARLREEYDHETRRDDSPTFDL